MFRHPTTKTSSTGAQAYSNGRGGNNDNATSIISSTIREIRSRTVNSTATSNARQLLAHKRQAMSMERLNGTSNPTSSAATSTSSMYGINTISDREVAKNSPNSGSSNSINGSTTSSPSRASSAGSTGGLNRTASRVSRFRSAKAVFERLSSVNCSNKGAEMNSMKADKPKFGTNVASRYAMARNSQTSSNSITSPRSRPVSKSPIITATKTLQANSEMAPSKTSQQPSKNEQKPKPQPRVTSTKRVITGEVGSTNQSQDKGSTAVNKSRPSAVVSPTKSQTASTITCTSTSTPTAQAKPPPKELIDKIVLEIARDAKKTHDLDCTIQDLSNCDISGIPETLDFDKCFQDVEMMTEEEARKLLSRKSDSPAALNSLASKELRCQNETIELKTCDSGQKPAREGTETLHQIQKIEIASPSAVELSYASGKSDDSLVPSSSGTPHKGKVRFSDEPAQVYDTHGRDDYDRRNDDIDPIAASKEYEIEKSKEREGIKDECSDDEVDSEAVEASVFNTNLEHQRSVSSPLSSCHDVPQLRSALRQETYHYSSDDNQSSQRLDNNNEQAARDRKEYIETLEREANLKQILEQNLRDLQSQYYETVKQLDAYKSSSENEVEGLKQGLVDMQNKYECSQNELIDSRELTGSLEKQLNDIKESSQLLEKKYHRAKKIIKDMQSREESFTRREQLYQQKLDEIEHELGVLISTFDRTIYDEGLKFFSLGDVLGCTKSHPACLDVFALLRQILTNFQANQSTQSAQIKQRIISMLEQHLASVIASANNCTTVSGTVRPMAPAIRGVLTSESDALAGTNKPAHPYAAHRLSHPNLPYPIGVGGQPTKIFHGLGPMPATLTTNSNDPSPPDSVNSYPSTNSLNSLNNNNNNNSNNNNNNNNSKQPMTINNDNVVSTKSAHVADSTVAALALQQQATLAPRADDIQPGDIQAPYQTNEWHEKPVSEWTTNQVSTWLLALGLDQYISKFEDRNVNGQSLINLDSTVLKGLGVLNSNDRNLLKKKIRELRVEMEKERKQIEKKLKENLKQDKSKSMQMANSQTTNKPSWKKGLLS